MPPVPPLVDIETAYVRHYIGFAALPDMCYRANALSATSQRTLEPRAPG